MWKIAPKGADPTVLGRHLRVRRGKTLDEGVEGGPMQSLELRRSNPELGSDTWVVESISVECEQDLPGTRLGELRDTSLRMVQAQVGHRSRQSSEKYAHLTSRAQLRLVESLTPSTPPHVKYASK